MFPWLNPYVSMVKLWLLRHKSPGCATRSAVFALLSHLPGTPSAGYDDDGIHMDLGYLGPK